MITAAGYTIREQLSQNGRTVLCRALRNADARPLLIKLPRPEPCSPADIEALRREYETTARLNLEGVLKGSAIETWEGGAALLMEPFSGVPLSRLTAGTRFGLNRALEIARDTAFVLGELHKRGVIHGNLSPSSILVETGTGRIRLTDVGLPPAVPGEDRDAAALLYCSPEQTGRMNRGVDFRTDFYSLGVTLYLLLTGDVPFRSEDPLQIIHSHIAREPADPSVLDPALPRPVSDIVLKLLAKNAEDRYQSAYGLQQDLEICLAGLQSQKAIAAFELAGCDVPPALLIPAVLYGREPEAGLLRRAFERAREGGSELLLVSGPAGIGKTALINGLRGAVRVQNGWFLSGKYDQLKKNVPYSSIIYAFKQLISRILAKNEETVKLWRDRLREALGSNAQLIIDVLPELKLIIGMQPSVSAAGPAESRNRFTRTLQKFVGAFARSGSPLVLFLDDMQWIDTASLDLIRLLLDDPNLTHFLLIGAFRSNEVAPGHPVRRLHDDMRGSDRIAAIELKPLSGRDTVDLLSDALRCSPDRAAPLARIVRLKTGGNPFFMNQMLAMLSRDGLLRYEPGAGWQWRIEEIARLEVADSVLDLLVSKIGRFAPGTREALTLASCIGSRFDLATLSSVRGLLEDRTLHDLGPALEEGLIIPADGAFLFFHDRIQEAASSLLSPEQRTEIHLRIGRLLLASTPEERLQERIFPIADQLNAGSDRITDPSERRRLAELNLLAGRKAKGSTAYSSAEQYLLKGLELLPEDCWTGQYTLALALYRECAECSYLNGNIGRAEQFFSTILAKAVHNREKAEIYGIRTALTQNRGNADESLKLGREGLRLLGLSLPADPGPAALMLEFTKIKWYLRGRTAEDLAGLPEMNDPVRLTITEILMNMAPAAYFRNKNLYTLIMLKLFTISLRFGRTNAAALACAAYGMVLSAVLGNNRRGLEFADLAVGLSRGHDDLGLQSSCDFIKAAFVQHGTHHIRSCSEFLLHGYTAGLEAGQFVFAGYCAGVDEYLRFFRGDRLDEVAGKAEQYLAALREIRNEDMILATAALRQAVLGLQGRTRSLTDLSTDEFDEESFVAGLDRDKRIFISCLYQTLKLPLYYLLGRHEDALRSAEYLDGNRDYMLGMYYLPHNNFYYSLTLAALYSSSEPRKRRSLRKRLRSNQKAMKRWARDCPENFRNKHTLVAAEMARIAGRLPQAETLYDQAISQATESGFIHEAAVANELAARFHLAHGHGQAARTYREEALRCYREWGAAAKTEQLEHEHLRIHRQVPGDAGDGQRTAKPLSPVHQDLDLATVLKLSHAISREISPDRLLPELMKIVIENAGARRGYLLLERDGRLLLEARGAVPTGEFEVLSSLPFEGAGVVAESVVNYAARTREAVVLNDAAREGMFSDDPLIRERQHLSILCAPILGKGRLAGILYLENDLASHAFTPDRVGVLNALSTPIAVSLENARLYDEVRRAKESLEESEQKFRTLAETMRSGIVIYRDERFLYVNPATEQMTGYTRAEFERLSFRDVIHPDFLPLVAQRAADRMADRSVPVQYEFKIVHKSGRERWVMSTAGRILYGREEALIATLLDITGQKAAEQERLELFEKNERQYRERIEEELRHQREKENILMDIHDGIGGIITNIGMLSELAQKSQDAGEAGKWLSTISRLAREGNIEIHSLMFSLDGREHTWRSLASELRHHGERLLAAHAVAFSMNASVEDATGQPQALLFLHLFRIYREALNNVIKHARASAVAVDLRVSRDGLSMAVLDDGQGFDPDAVTGKGRGVGNMKSRAAEIGGSLSIATGEGTVVSLTIPFSGRNPVPAVKTN